VLIAVVFLPAKQAYIIGAQLRNWQIRFPGGYCRRIIFAAAEYIVVNKSILILATLVAISLSSAIASASQCSALLETHSGLVEGVCENRVESFKGIPFARPPVGPLRWTRPQSPQPWDGVLKADRYRPDCAQPGRPGSDEDCLYLNVFRPQGASAPLAVMVWFHGGSNLIGGASTFPATALANKGVLVVTFNYRVGRLGFFAHPALANGETTETVVNFAHLDMLATLVWVQENIERFGGDPGNVTAFGVSAGAGAILALLTQHPVEHLFHKAIVQSAGVPTSRAQLLGFLPYRDAVATSVSFAEAQGIGADDPNAAVLLRQLPTKALINDVDPVRDTFALTGVTPGAPGLPGATLDGVSVHTTVEAVLQRGRQSRIPVIVGATSAELALGAAADKDELFAHIAPFQEDARAIYEPSGETPLAALVQAFFADRFYVEPSVYHADSNARANIPTWLYRFSYVPETLEESVPGAAHGSDVAFIFGNPALFEARPPVTVGAATSQRDRDMADMISAYWIAFARTGTPAVDDLPVWPAHVERISKVMDFSKGGPVFGDDPVKDRLELWRKYWDYRDRQGLPVRSE
jgi:para-nitrobenzyl esterase